MPAWVRMIWAVLLMYAAIEAVWSERVLREEGMRESSVRTALARMLGLMALAIAFGAGRAFE